MYINCQRTIFFEKYTLVILFFIGIASCTNNQKSIIVSGIVVEPNSLSKVYLKKRSLPGRKFLDIDSVTTIGKDGKFTFSKDKLTEPGYYQVFYEDSSSRTSAPLLIDEGFNDEISMRIDTSSFTVGDEKINVRKIQFSGSKDNELLDKFFAINRDYYANKIAPTKSEINKLFKINPQSPRLDSLDSVLNIYEMNKYADLNDILINEMGTSISIFQTMSTWDQTNEGLMDTIVQRFKMEKPHSFITPHILAKAETMKKSGLIGKKSPDFTLMDPNHVAYSFDDISSEKYILIDFWASWCGPCIKEIPALKKIHELAGENLEIVFISVDKIEERWRNSVEKNEMPWLNLIDSKEQNVSKKFGVSQLPTKYLIDKDGIIIQKNISLPELRKLVEY